MSSALRTERRGACRGVLLAALWLILAPAHALSTQDIAYKALDFMGEFGLAKKNDIELLKFSVKHPGCAEKIFTTTIAQDYSLIATVIGMKAAKVGGQVSIPGLKSFNQQQCHALNPLQRFYAFTEITGDRFIKSSPFVPSSQILKQQAKQQLDQGKGQLEGELAKVPAAGPVLLNWGCLCNAAFESNLLEESLAKNIYLSGAKLVAAAKKGNVGEIVEVALGEFGPTFACKLGAAYSGIGQVPVVGSATADLCGTVLGQAVAWGVKGAKAVGKGVVAGTDAAEKLLFGDDSHMSYDSYFAKHWLPSAHAGVANCLATDQKCSGLGAIQAPIWNACVNYFDEHNQYLSTAKKTCDDMRDKRHNPMVKGFAQKMQAAAQAHVQTIASTARMMAIGDYGKNQADPADFFLKNCEVKLRAGFDFPPPQKNVPHPDAWQIACLKAGPAFVALFNQEKQALQQQLAQLGQQGCLPPPGWTAGKGIKLVCENVAAYESCKDTLKAGNEKWLCSFKPKEPTPVIAAAGASPGAAPVGAGAQPELPPSSAPPAPPVTQRSAPSVPTQGAPADAHAPNPGAGRPPRVHIKDQKPGNVQANPNPINAYPQPQFTPPAGTRIEGSRPGAPAQSTQRAMSPASSHLPAVQAPPAAADRPLPDLVSDPQLQLHGMPARFGASVEFDDQKTHTRAGGVCKVAVQHTVRNAGASNAPAFRTTWEGGAEGPLTRAWLALPAGQASTQIEQLSLRPGTNELRLVIDRGGRAGESRAPNNAQRLVVIVRGSCEAAAPGRAQLPPNPANGVRR